MTQQRGEDGQRSLKNDSTDALVVSRPTLPADQSARCSHLSAKSASLQSPTTRHRRPSFKPSAAWPSAVCCPASIQENIKKSRNQIQIYRIPSILFHFFSVRVKLLMPFDIIFVLQANPFCFLKELLFSIWRFLTFEDSFPKKDSLPIPTCPALLKRLHLSA
jgi:hypothetical protein